MSVLYEKFKKYQVPAPSVEDFHHRYTKSDRFIQYSPEYQTIVLRAARDDLVQLGYTITGRHDSVAGEVLAYYGPNRQKISQRLTTRTTVPAIMNPYPWPPAPLPPASGVTNMRSPPISFPPTRHCMTLPDAKSTPTIPVSPIFCPPPAGRNCLTINLQPSVLLTIYLMAAPAPLLPPMIPPSAIIRL